MLTTLQRDFSFKQKWKIWKNFRAQEPVSLAPGHSLKNSYCSSTGCKAWVAKWVGIHLAFSGWLWDGNCYGHHPFSIVRTSSKLGFRGRRWVLEWSKLPIPPSAQQLQLGSEDLPGVGRCCITILIKKPVWIEPSGQILSERNFLLCSSPEKKIDFSCFFSFLGLNSFTVQGVQKFTRKNPTRNRKGSEQKPKEQ